MNKLSEHKMNMRTHMFICSAGDNLAQEPLLLPEKITSCDPV